MHSGWLDHRFGRGVDPRGDLLKRQVGVRLQADLDRRRRTHVLRPLVGLANEQLPARALLELGQRVCQQSEGRGLSYQPLHRTLTKPMTPKKSDRLLRIIMQWQAKEAEKKRTAA